MMSKHIGQMERILWAAVVIAVAYVSYSLGASRARNEPPTHEKQLQTVDINVLRQQMAKISELATVSYDYTDIASHKKTEKLWGYDIPFSTSTILIRYSGTIKAGVDINAATITVRDSTVSIALPSPRIIAHSVDPHTIKILNQDNGLFSSIKIADFQAFCMAHQDSMQNAAIASGLLDEASANTMASLELLMAPLRGMGYTVVLTSPKEEEETFQTDNFFAK